MVLLPWIKQYSIQIEKIDAQHKILVNYLNQLYEAMLVGKANEVLDDLFKGLTIYSSTHFRNEENYMFSKGYSDYNQHINLMVEQN